jgi:hypothetical protein
MSSAAKVVDFLLTHNAALLAVVPAERIVPGRLGPGTKLPAVTVSHIGTNRRKVVKQAATEFCRARIQVTVHARTIPEQDTVQRLVRKALPATRGIVAGVDVDDIQSGDDGPDIDDAAPGIYMGVSDYIVTFNE